MKLNFLAIVIALCCTLHVQAKDFRITDYGAIADGKTLATKSIQRAVDDANKAGGGKVIIPPGKFVTGWFELKSNIELHLENNAVLLGSPLRADYDGSNPLALIVAKDQQNISITGKGVIDAQGELLIRDIFKRLEEGSLKDPNWPARRPGEQSRPFIIYFNNCENVVLKHVTIRNGVSWVQNYTRCRKMLFDSIKVESTTYWNNDGLDLVDCSDAKISNCFINAADDAICLKSEDRNSTCENILVENCKLRSSANAFKMGTASKGGFKDILVRNITVYDTYRSAVAIESVDGGVVENVKVENVKATNTGNAILIRLGHRNSDEKRSILRNVYVANVYVEVPNAKPDKGYPFEGPLLRYPSGVKPPTDGTVVSVSPWNHSFIDSTAIIYQHNVFPSSITGQPGNAVENVLLENIEIAYEGGASKSTAFFPLDSLHIITEAPTSYPEFSMFGELPAWGLYVRHVDGLMIKNMKLHYKKEDFRVPVIFDDVKQLVLEKVKIPTVASVKTIVLNNVAKPVLKEVDGPY